MGKGDAGCTRDVKTQRQRRAMLKWMSGQLVKFSMSQISKVHRSALSLSHKFKFVFCHTSPLSCQQTSFLSFFALWWILSFSYLFQFICAKRCPSSSRGGCQCPCHPAT